MDSKKKRYAVVFLLVTLMLSLEGVLLVAMDRHAIGMRECLVLLAIGCVSLLAAAFVLLRPRDRNTDERSRKR